ncbi:MAG: DUF6188 family protein [Mycobacteriales bacterium]
MDLGIQGQSLAKESFGYTVSLETDAGFEICIENIFFLHVPGGDFELSPGESNAEAKYLHSLVGQKVTSATAEKSGALKIALDNGSYLRVEPDETYEAWTVAGPSGLKVVCMPGGELAVWSSESK